MASKMSVASAPPMGYVVGNAGGLRGKSVRKPSLSVIDNQAVIDACKPLILSDKQLKQVMAKLLEAIKLGLGKDTHGRAVVKCFSTFVQDLPSGEERGKFLALDLGGTNFRVLVITLDKNKFNMESKVYAIPQEVMTGSGKQLFDLIAECLADFMIANGLSKEKLPLGFTFSFPLAQFGLTKGVLKNWTKGFSCSGVVGEDVVELLQAAIKRRKDVDIDIVGILNDTTGTLMSCAWMNRNCRVGLIVGTGCNACYVERVENVETFAGERSAARPRPTVVVNTEWGALGERGELDFARTEFDREVDRNSINAGQQIFEKMISGMYMGEIVRQVLVKLVTAKALFGGRGSAPLNTRWRFKAKYVSDVEGEERGETGLCRSVLAKLELSHGSDGDCACVRYVCECVSRRSAHLASAGVATLLDKMDAPSAAVGVDGSLYRYHPHFHDLMVDKIGQLAARGREFELMLSEDGSGRGAALVAAVASMAKK